MKKYIVGLLALGIMAVPSNADAATKYPRHYEGDDFNVLGTADGQYKVEGAGSFLARGKMRIMVFQTSDAEAAASAVASFAPAGFGWVSCADRVVTYAQWWTDGPVKRLNKFEARKGNKWLKRYAKRNSCTYRVDYGSVIDLG